MCPSIDDLQVMANNPTRTTATARGIRKFLLGVGLFILSECLNRSNFVGAPPDLLLVLIEPEQVFQQEVLSVDQHGVAGTHATAVTQYSGRRRVAFSNWREVPIDQRLHDALAGFSIKLSASSVRSNRGKPE